MADPFTLRIYVPSGDPDGVRIIDRMNWTGRGIVVPRDRWVEVKAIAERRQFADLLRGMKGFIDEVDGKE